MKKSLARFLSIALAVALVVTCAITGLVLPTAADTEAQTPATDAVVNLLAKDAPFTIEYGNSFNLDGGRNYTLSENFIPGEAYVLRFEAKGAPVGIYLSPGGNTEKTIASDEWRIYQQSIRVGASSEGKNQLWISWSPDWSNAQEGDTVQVRNLQVYRVTSAFNIIPDGDMNNGSFPLIEKSAQDKGEDGIRAIVEDPTGANNKVFQIAQNANNPYWNLSSVYESSVFDGTKIYKLRFRYKGSIRFHLGFTNILLNNPGASTDNGNYVTYVSNYGWKTAELFVCPNGSAFASWLQFAPVTWNGTAQDLWLDDIELYETGVAESWTIDETIHPEAQFGTASLSNFIKTTPVNSYPFGTKSASPFVWTLTGGTTNVTLSNATNGWLNVPNSDYVFANEKPTLTVTDGVTTKNVNVEWSYADRPIANSTFNDIVKNVHVWTTAWSSSTTWASTAGKGMDGSAAGYATAKTGTVYMNQRMILQPNTTYRFSMLAKASSGNIKVQFSNFTDCTNSGTITYNGDGKWNYLIGWVKTGAAPKASGNSGINIQFNPASDDAAPEAIIDNVMLEKQDAIEELVLGGSFDVVGGLNKGWGTGVEVVDASQVEGGNIGGNTTNVLKLATGTGESAQTAFPTTYFVPSSAHSMLKVGKAYKLTFKHYGGKATINMATWLSGNVLGGGGKLTCAESTEWTEYSLNYVPGAYADDLTYRIRLANTGTTDAYFDDFKWEEIENTVYAPFSNAEMGVGHSDNFWISGVDAVTGQSYSGQRVVWDMSVGTKLYFSFVGNGKVIPIPSSLKVHYEDGTVVPILNTHHTPMTGSNGDQFGPIEVREGVAYIEYNFAPETTGYQWGTLGSAVRRDVETEEVNGIRFLNRLYMNGLDWANAEGFTVTIDGKEWTVKEIGALARVATNDDTELDVYTATKRGICYSADDQYGTVRVTDYTKRYFDFTVVIPVDAADYDTEYEFGAYMVLTDGTTEETVYTEAMTDSVTAALVRGA